MFYTSSNNQDFFQNLDLIGVKSAVRSMKNVLIKINLSRAYSKNLPRTDMTILQNTIEYIYQNGRICTTRTT